MVFYCVIFVCYYGKVKYWFLKILYIVNKNKIMKNSIKELAVYQTKGGEIKLRGDFDNETLWASQKQLAALFDVDVRTVNEHIKNIIKSKELVERSTIRKFQIVQKEGKREVNRKVEHYNLDMMVSVGYRVNSKVATNFRKWATKILRGHITKGFTINKYQLKKNHEEFLRAVDDIKLLAKNNSKIKTNDVLELVKTFSGTWFSLDSYDKQILPKKGASKKKVKVGVVELYDGVDVFKGDLIGADGATELFAREKDVGSLGGILGNVLQSVFGKDAYPTIEGKAAHLLYFVVKNHPFTDGNKRTGAFVFIWFLQRAGFDFGDRVSPGGLTTLTLLIAESNPREMSKMIGLVLLILRG